MDKREIEALNQKNKVEAMEKEFKTGSFPHPHDRIQYRMNIIIQRVKLGLLQSSITN